MVEDFTPTSSICVHTGPHLFGFPFNGSMNVQYRVERVR